MQLSGLDPRIRPAADAALRWASDHGVKVTVTSVRRPYEQQAALYARYKADLAAGRTPPWPAAPPGYSGHQYGLAWDSVVSAPTGQERAYQAWWDAVRNAFGWEIPSNDRIHAQVPQWAARRLDWIAWAGGHP